MAASAPRQILVCFNHVLPDVAARGVPLERLGFKPGDWGGGIASAVAADAWDLALPLEYGHRATDRCAKVLSVAVVALSRPVQWPTLNAIAQPQLGRRNVKDCLRWAQSCACAVPAGELARTMGALSSRPRRSSLAVVLNDENAAGIASALRSIWVAMQEQMHGHHAQLKTALRDEASRVRALSQVMERTLRGGAPVQLGFSDLEGWLASSDPCRSRFARGVRGLGDMLGDRCTCGTVSFRTRQPRFGDVAPMTEWFPYAMHQLKNSAAHKFLSGDIAYAGQGGLIRVDGAPDDDDSSDLVHLAVPLGASLNVRDRMALVVEEGDLKAAAEEIMDITGGNKGSLFVRAAHFGEFHMCASVLGEDRQTLRLQRSSFASGRVLVCIGDYVGAESNAIGVLLRSLREVPSPACRALLPAHCSAADLEPDGANHLSGLTAGAAAAVARKLGKSLTADQTSLVECMAASKRGAFFCEACPGTGKSLTAVSALLGARDVFDEEVKGVVLLQQRTQRDETLSLIRSALDDPFEAAAIGRPAGDDSAADEGYLDPALLRALDDRTESIKGRIDDLRAQLQTAQENLDLTAPEGKEWKLKSEEMLALTFQYRNLVEEARGTLFGGVCVFVMTVDCFLQINCGKNWLSPIFRKFEFRLGVVDEGHQMDFAHLLPVAHRLGTALAMFDRAQDIEHLRPTEFLREHSPLSFGQYYAWNQACHGPCPLRLWDYAPTSHVFTLSVTWRFGPLQCKFMRDTSKEYGRKGHPLICALDHDDRERYGNLADVPQTAVRFVRYSDTQWFPAVTRGVLAADAEAIGLGTRRGAPDRGGGAEEAPRAAACKPVFEQMLFEGLLFLRAIALGRALAPGGTRSTTIAHGTKAILTMVLANDVRVNFDVVVRGALENATLMESFGIPAEACDAPHLWRVMTPEAASGADALLQQTTVFPRNLGAFDVQGNARDAMRRNVAFTRGILFASSHECIECLEDGRAAPHWKAHFDASQRDRALAVWESPCKSGGPTRPVDPQWIDGKCELECANRLFDAVRAFLWPLPKVVADMRMADPWPASCERPPSLTLVQAIQLGSANLFDDGGALSDVTQLPTPNPIDGASWVSDSDIYGLAPDREALQMSLPQLLKPIGVRVNNGLATVTAHFLDASPRFDAFRPTPEVAARVAAAGRVAALQSIRLFPDTFSEGRPLYARLLPCKRLRLGGDAREARAALAVALARGSAETRDVVMYQHVGNPDALQPPNTWPTLFKKMPLHIARCVLATMHFLAGTFLDDASVHVRSRSQSDEDKAAAAAERDDMVHSVNSMVNLLRQRPGLTRDAILPPVALSAAATAARADLDDSLQCVVCDGTGKLLEYRAVAGGTVSLPCPLCDACPVRGGTETWDAYDPQLPCPLCVD
ncbi:unnamed protein product [Prorocentrum cordatum]|uniref:Uncharacterized protein n=1 Tax=Prorocentrum cordatum TaxID=2364126 RepID=A0ABN9QWB3_9DINO|nr:unnamed protein product [Polarella glacialis]